MAPVSPPVFTHARTFNAPLAIVWQAFTEKEHLLAWFGPPGMPLGTAELDLRPGGLFYYGMQVPGGGMSYGKFVYREIVPMTKLSLVVSFSDEQRGVSRHPMSSSWPLEVLSTFEFSEADGQTTLRMTGTPINASDEEMTTFGGATASMTQGWDGSLDQLDRFLTERRARTLVTKPAATDYALTRTFNAPRELVWRMWTEAEHLAGWFGPTDYRNEATMDARTGGAWSITMINADGTRYPMTGQVLECDPPTRIVMSVDTNAHPAAWRELVNRARGLSADAPSFPLTWIVTLEDVPEGTRMHIVNRLAHERDRDAIFGLGASDGWSQSLDKLERVLANGA